MAFGVAAGAGSSEFLSPWKKRLREQAMTHTLHQGKDSVAARCRNRQAAPRIVAIQCGAKPFRPLGRPRNEATVICVERLDSFQEGICFVLSGAFVDEPECA
jgi:hypothetical protein